jgi:hypothetical protein
MHAPLTLNIVGYAAIGPLQWPIGFLFCAMKRYRNGRSACSLPWPTELVPPVPKSCAKLAEPEMNGAPVVLGHSHPMQWFSRNRQIPAQPVTSARASPGLLHNRFGYFNRTERVVIMKIAIFALSGLAILIATVLGYAATRPDTFVIQRAVKINAPPEKIFAFVNDFHKWPLWAPQDTEDPKMMRTFSGATSGKGAVSEWRGSGNTGNGRMEIMDSSEPQKVAIQVDFEKPFKSRNINTILLERQGNSTMVTWKWNGTNVYMLKVMSVIFDMDATMGKHFEAGLNNLKALAEKQD